MQIFYNGTQANLLQWFAALWLSGIMYIMLCYISFCIFFFAFAISAIDIYMSTRLVSINQRILALELYCQECDNVIEITYSMICF